VRESQENLFKRVLPTGQRLLAWQDIMQIKSQLAALRRNVNAGTRLSLFRNTAAADFSISLDQLVLLIILNFLLAFVIEFIGSLPSPAFNPYAIAANGLNVLLFLFAAYLVSRLLMGTSAFLRLGIYIYSMSPFIYLCLTLLGRFGDLLPSDGLHYYGLLYLCFLGWVLLATGWAFTRVAGGFTRRVPAALLLVVLAWMVPVYYFAEDSTLWYASADDGVDEYAAFRNLDVERLYYRQPELLDAHLQVLQSQRSGTEDLYFIGFAGYALQNIFRNEIEFARALFDERFGTQDRSLMLINNLETRDELPLATSMNLQRTLLYIGEIIDPDEDMVVLFLTSHGDRAELSINFWPMGLNDITPGMLKQYLDNAGIKWRVIMVSACYSGSFMETLKDDNTAIMTASSADRTSFGCDDKRELTYFGEALLKNQLQEQYSIEAAFSNTAREIERREKVERLDPSYPQIFIGGAMQEKLRRLETSLSRAAAADASAMLQPLH
jgi:hypothetical protein